MATEGNVFSYDADWADNRTLYFPTAVEMRYVWRYSCGSGVMYLSLVQLFCKSYCYYLFVYFIINNQFKYWLYYFWIILFICWIQNYILLTMYLVFHRYLLSFEVNLIINLLVLYVYLEICLIFQLFVSPSL